MTAVEPSARTRDWALVPLAMVPLVVSLVGFFANAHDRTPMTIFVGISFVCGFIGFVRCYFGIGRRNHLPLLIMYGGYMFWFFWPAIRGAFTDDQWYKPAAKVVSENRHALTGLVAINLFVFLVALMNQVRISAPVAKQVRRWLGARPAAPNSRVFLIVMIGIIGCLGFYVVAAGGPLRAFQLMLASRAEKKPWDREGYDSTSLAAADLVVEASLVALSALALHLALDSDQSWARRITLLFFGLASIAWIAIERGTRSVLIEVALPPLGMYYARVSIGLTAARLRRTLVLLALLAGLIFAANAQAKYRRTMQVDQFTFEVTNNDYFIQTALAVAVQEKENRYFHDSALLHIISGPVPRILWKDKPVMDSMFAFTEYIWGYDTWTRGGNVLPSVVGEYYMNWGWFGVLEIGIALGFLIRLLDMVFMACGHRDLARFAVLGIVAYIFVSFRMLSFAFFTPMLTTVIFSIFLARLPIFQGGGKTVRAKPVPVPS